MLSFDLYELEGPKMKQNHYLIIITLACFSATSNGALAAPEAIKPSTPTVEKASEIAIIDIQARLELFDREPTLCEPADGRVAVDNFLSGQSGILIGFDARNNRHRR